MQPDLPPAPAQALPRRGGHPAEPRAIVIGASTGGVEALYALLSAFPADCPPVCVVQHMRSGFMEGFVAGLNRACAARVVSAQDRVPVRAGHIYIAPGGDAHLGLAGNAGIATRLIPAPPVQGHRPSVDWLFLSAAALPRPPVAALLTGMGRDGAAGLLAIQQAGGPTFAQDEESSVVFGMPRAALELGAVRRCLPLAAIPSALLAAAGYAPHPNQP